jgi:hypothetical protein
MFSDQRENFRKHWRRVQGFGQFSVPIQAQGFLSNRLAIAHDLSRFSSLTPVMILENSIEKAKIPLRARAVWVWG